MNPVLFLLGAATLGGDPITVSGTGCGGCGAPAVSYGSSYLSVYAPMTTTCDPCGGRVGLLARLKARFGNWNRPAAVCPPPVTACAPAAPACATGCSVPVPTCGTPVVSRPLFTGFTTSCTDPWERKGLLARLREKFGSATACDACAAPLSGCSWGSSVAATPICGYPAGCTSSYGTVLSAPASSPSPAVTPPVTMPQEKPTVPLGEPKKDEPKTDEPKKEEKKELLGQVPSLDIPAVDVPRVPVLGGTSGKY
jgi:hypothetical protein